MKLFEIAETHYVLVLIYILSAVGCSCGSPVDETITNETAVETIAKEVEESNNQLEALRDSLPEEMVEQIERLNKEREDEIYEDHAASSYKTMKDAEVEVMLQRWMTAYENGLSTYRDSLLGLTGRDAVLKAWGDSNTEKRDELTERFKKVRAGSAAP